MSAGAGVEIEFLGLVRLRAGVDRCTAAPGTLGEVLAGLARRYPGLSPDVIASGRASDHVLVALDGRVVDDPALELAAGQSVVLTSAQAGG